MAVTGTFTGNLTFAATAATVAVPTGSKSFTGAQTSWTCPTGVKVVKVSVSGDGGTSYVGVTAGKTYSLQGYMEGHPDSDTWAYDVWNTKNNRSWYYYSDDIPEITDGSDMSFTLAWSPKINTQTPDVTDY